MNFPLYNDCVFKSQAETESLSDRIWNGTTIFFSAQLIYEVFLILNINELSDLSI